MKILVCGDVNGLFSALISKVNSVIKKTGSYDALFCVGEFFGKDKESNEKLLKNHFLFPISTFVLGPASEDTVDCYPDIDGCQLCNNVTYLGRRGFFFGISSLSVAFVSGREKKDKETSSIGFDLSDISSLKSTISSKKDYRGIDILLTSQWPSGVSKYGISFPEEDKINGSDLVSQLALLLKPRYHFSGHENVAYERQPYRNHVILTEASQHTTRFVALARVGNTENKKFIYAFNINPMKHVDGTELTKQPTDVTEAPFKLIPNIFAEQEAQEEKTLQYFYDSQAIERGDVRNPKKRKADGGTSHISKKRVISPESCWFCLANPQAEKHLVTSVGDQCYLALAKGGLSEDHMLIIPINHYESIVASDVDVLSELEIYKGSLTKYYKSMDKCVVFYERNYKSSHLQLQAIPLPLSFERKLEESITKFAQSKQMELKELPQHADLKQIISPGVPYFYVEIPGKRRFYLKVKQGFPLHFGRDMLCQPLLLNSPEKVEWKFCQLSRKEEEDCCANFRKSFKLFDPFI